MPEKATGNYSGSVSSTSLVNGGQGYRNGTAGGGGRECGENGNVRVGERRSAVYSNERAGERRGNGGNAKIGERQNAVQGMNIGTWNVRTMKVVGKLENIKVEMRRREFNVLGLGEVRWENEGDFESDEFRVIHSGSTGGQKGVALILDKEFGKRVKKVVYHSDRLLLVRVEADPVDIVLLQVYMPTSAEDDEVIESMYEQIEGLIRQEKATDNVIIMGDWNAVVGEGREDREVGGF